MAEADAEYEEVGHFHRQKICVVGTQAIVAGSITMSGDGTTGEALDREYLSRWTPAPNVSEQWTLAQRAAALAPT